MTIAKKYVLYSGDATTRADRRILSILFVIILFFTSQGLSGASGSLAGMNCQKSVWHMPTTGFSLHHMSVLQQAPTTGCFTHDLWLFHDRICVFTISIVQDNLSYNL